MANKSEIYISPENKVFAIRPTYPGVDSQKYELKSKWYELGLVAPGPNSDDYLWIIQYDSRCIPYEFHHFMTKSEWRNNKLNQLGI